LFSTLSASYNCGRVGSDGGKQCKKDHNLSETENFQDHGNESIRKYSTYTVISLRHSQAEDMYLITR
jgi:hypothetical protein